MSDAISLKESREGHMGSFEIRKVKAATLPLNYNLKKNKTNTQTNKQNQLNNKLPLFCFHHFYNVATTLNDLICNCGRNNEQGWKSQPNMEEQFRMSFNSV